MEKQKVIDMLNTMEVTDFDLNDGAYHSIFVRLNYDVSNMLWILGVDEDSLNSTENSIDILPISKSYAEFNGYKWF